MTSEQHQNLMFVNIRTSCLSNERHVFSWLSPLLSIFQEDFWRPRVGKISEASLFHEFRLYLSFSPFFCLALFLRHSKYKLKWCKGCVSDFGSHGYYSWYCKWIKTNAIYGKNAMVICKSWCVTDWFTTQTLENTPPACLTVASLTTLFESQFIVLSNSQTMSEMLKHCFFLGCHYIKFLQNKWSWLLF